MRPMGENPRTSTCIHSVFFSYASSLIVPRIGEFARCAILRRYDGVPFPKALGTVVTERAIDSILMMSVAGVTLLFQMSMFGTFFRKTGTSLDTLLGGFSAGGYLVVAVCLVAVLFLLHLLLRRLSIYKKVKDVFSGIWQGVVSLRNVRNKPLYACFTIGTWLCYFLHYYLTFFCFDFTADLGWQCALVTFVVGTIAVIVPTPNGAGPWHFAVKTMLMLYGVAETSALFFVIIVHTIQTLLVILLGVWAMAALAFTKKRSTAEKAA